MSTPNFFVGLDVHKDSVTLAVFRDRDPEPMRVHRLPNDHRKLRRYVERLSSEGSCPCLLRGVRRRIRAPARLRRLGDLL